MKILNILTSLYHVERESYTVHERGIKTRYSGLILILRSGKHEKLSEDIRVKHAHDGTGKLVKSSGSSTHS